MFFGREPALILGFVQVLLTLLVVFGLDLTEAQTAAILAVSAAGLSLWTRQKVAPVDKSGNVV